MPALHGFAKVFEIIASLSHSLQRELQNHKTYALPRNKKTFAI